MKIFENIAQSQELDVYLINSGIILVLFESIFKKELLPSSFRLDALKLVSRIFKSLDEDHPLNRIVMSFIPPALHYVLKPDKTAT